MAGKNLTTKKAKELLADTRAKARDKHDKSSLKNLRVPLFKVGDPVWILTMVLEEGKIGSKQMTPPLAGTVESAPKSGRGLYSVRCDGGVLQDVDESLLALVDQRAAAKTGVH